METKQMHVKSKRRERRAETLKYGVSTTKMSSANLSAIYPRIDVRVNKDDLSTLQDAHQIMCVTMDKTNYPFSTFVREMALVGAEMILQKSLNDRAA